MPRIYLVRHGEPAGGSADPDLTLRGHDQAAAVASHLEPLGPLAVVTSPLRRTRSTAAPLAAAWQAEVVIDARVRELPSPSYEPPARQQWLRWALALTFAELGPDQRRWRDEIVTCLLALPRDTVVFSHAVVINCVLGHIGGDDRVLHFVPAHCSVTVVDVDDGVLSLVERGEGRDHAIT